MTSDTIALCLQGVGRRFSGLQAVRDVTLDVPHGERHAIIGSNGAGKTTLFNLIGGDIAVTSGRVILFDKDVTHMPTHQRVRLGLGRTYQTALLFPQLSTLDTIYLAVRGATAHRMSVLRPGAGDRHRAKAAALARRVGLEKSLNTKVGDLSHGQQRQIELAMALAGDPRLILLDEPASGLSQGERVLLSEMLRALDRDLTLLIIEHDMDVAFQVADVVTVMHNGAVLATGRPDEIRNNEMVHAIYLGAHHE